MAQSARIALVMDIFLVSPSKVRPDGLEHKAILVPATCSPVNHCVMPLTWHGKRHMPGPLAALNTGVERMDLSIQVGKQVVLVRS